MRGFVRFLKDQTGAVAIEYSVIGTLVSVLIIGSALSIGTSVSASLSPLASGLN